MEARRLANARVTVQFELDVGWLGWKHVGCLLPCGALKSQGLLPCGALKAKLDPLYYLCSKPGSLEA